MTIGELAKKSGASLQTIRYYEERRLLPRARRWAGSDYRDFDEDAVTCLQFIRSAKSLGFTLQEIQRLLDLRVPPRGSCEEVAGHLNHKIVELDRRMAEMRQMRKALSKMVTACCRRRTNDSCLVLWALEQSGGTKMPRVTAEPHWKAKSRSSRPNL